MDEFRKNNTNPIFQQYITISEENARLNKELNMLKYKIIDIQEEHDNMQRIYNEDLESKKKVGDQLKSLIQENQRLLGVKGVI